VQRGACGAGDAFEAFGDRDGELGAQAARGGDRLERGGAVGGIEVVDDLIVAADQRPERGDLVVAGAGVPARPLGQLRDGRREPLAAGQQLMQVVAKFGLVGRVGAEVLTADAAVAVLAAVAARLDVRGFGAQRVQRTIGGVWRGARRRKRRKAIPARRSGAQAG
jgi:hypothetical protein